MTKLNLTYFVFISLITAFVLTSSSKMDPRNPPTGQTGAPNETTCSTASGCHSGGNFSGSVAITGLPNEILPSTSYNVTVTLSSTCSLTGFELTVLDIQNLKCGDLIAGTNNNLKTINSRQYARQTNATSLSNGKASYSLTWKSPASIIGDTAIFYYVMLQANNNGGKTGDNVAKGTKKVSLSPISSNEELKNIGFSMYPNPTSDFLKLTVDDGIEIHVQLLNPYGINIQSFVLNGSKILDVRQLTAGIYFIKLKSDTGELIKSFIIQ